jgi:predicted Zn-dependent peptidase
MLFRGSTHYPSAYVLNRAIEELGGTLHGATHADSTLFEVTLPPDNALRGLVILGDILTGPTFAELAVEKRIVREEILEYLDEEGHEVDPENLTRQLIFGAHPLGLTITGSLHNLQRFGASDLKSHMQKHYVASNMVLCVTGAVEPRAVLRAAHAALGALPAGVAPALNHFRGVVSKAKRSRAGTRKTRTPAWPRVRHVESLGSQTDVRLCFSTFGATDPRYLALELLVRVIDDGMSTRLHRRICEELGLAYEVFATLEPFEECGVLDVGGAVEHDKVASFMRSVLSLLSEARDKPVTRAELDKAKRRYAWQLEAILDDPQSMSTHYGLRALVGQDGHLRLLRQQVERITTADLRNVACELFRRDHLHVVTVGMQNAKQQRAARDACDILPSERC